MLFLLPPLPHPPPLFPYTTLFRSFRLLIYRKPFALQKLCDSPACRNDLNIRQIQLWKSDPHTIDGSPVKKDHAVRDRKSKRRNSSHVATSYAVFCLNEITTMDYST